MANATPVHKPAPAPKSKEADPLGEFGPAVTVVAPPAPFVDVEALVAAAVALAVSRLAAPPAVAPVVAPYVADYSKLTAEDLAVLNAARSAQGV